MKYTPFLPSLACAFAGVITSASASDAVDANARRRVVESAAWTAREGVDDARTTRASA